MNQVPVMQLYLAEHMAKRRLTDARVAYALGVAPETVWRWRNHRSRPRHEDIARLASLLDCEAPESLYSLTRDLPSIDSQLKDVPNHIYEQVYQIAVSVRELFDDTKNYLQQVQNNA